MGKNMKKETTKTVNDEEAVVTAKTVTDNGSESATVDAGGEQERLKSAEEIVKRNIYWSMGAGIAPFPLFDIVAISALQAKMLKELGDLYSVPFSKHLVVNSLGVLLGGIGSFELGRGLTSSLIKFIPGAGGLAGTVALPVSAGAITYAVGHVFIMHLESGGTFLNFDASKMKTCFQDLISKGKAVVGKKEQNEEAETVAS